MNPQRNKTENYWSRNVTPIFAPLLASMSIEMPVNPRQWLLKALGGSGPTSPEEKVPEPPSPRSVSPPKAGKSEVRGATGVSPDGKVHPGSVSDNVMYAKEAFKIDPVTRERIGADTDDSEDVIWPLSRLPQYRVGTGTGCTSTRGFWTAGLSSPHIAVVRHRWRVLLTPSRDMVAVMRVQ